MKKKLLGMLVMLMLIFPVLPVAAAEPPARTENLDYTFDCIDGGKVSTQSNGIPKLLIFFSNSCGNCMQTLRSISSSDWVQSDDMEVCAIEFHSTVSATEVATFRDTYCPEGYITFATSEQSDLGSYAMFEYANSSSFAFPVIAMINAQNEICAVTTGLISASEIQDTYLPLLNSSPDDSDNPDDSNNPDNPDNPDDSNNPDNPDNPDDSNNPDNPDSPDDSNSPENPGDSQNPDDSGNPGNSQNPGNTQTSNGSQNPGNSQEVSDSQETGGSSEPQNIDNASAVYAAFLQEMADTILNTKQTEIAFSTNTWTCFNRTFLEAIRRRPDVTVTVDYIYKGKPYVLKIPAGTNVDLLMDKNGFAGFRYIEKILNEQN